MNPKWLFLNESGFQREFKINMAVSPTHFEYTTLGRYYRLNDQHRTSKK